MASTSGNTRLAVAATIVSFVAGCWIGMGSEAEGDAYCVVTGASAPGRPGYAPGQLAPLPEGATGCQPGEPMVCGRFEPELGEERRFVSDACP
jgi:hypothetical protein